MVKINNILLDYLKLKTKKNLKGLRQDKFREGSVGVITFQALAKAKTPQSQRSVYGTQKMPRVHIATLTSQGNVFLMRSSWKYIK